MRKRRSNSRKKFERQDSQLVHRSLMKAQGMIAPGLNKIHSLIDLNEEVQVIAKQKVEDAGYFGMS